MTCVRPLDPLPVSNQFSGYKMGQISPVSTAMELKRYRLCWAPTLACPPRSTHQGWGWQNNVNHQSRTPLLLLVAVQQQTFLTLSLLFCFLHQKNRSGGFRGFTRQTHRPFVARPALPLTPACGPDTSITGELNTWKHHISAAGNRSTRVLAWKRRSKGENISVVC